LPQTNKQNICGRVGKNDTILFKIIVNNVRNDFSLIERNAPYPEKMPVAHLSPIPDEKIVNLLVLRSFYAFHQPEFYPIWTSLNLKFTDFISSCDLPGKGR
jgi:hypothetical protein